MEFENDDQKGNEDNNNKQDNMQIEDINQEENNLNQQNIDIKNKKDSFLKNKNYNITGIYQKETPNNYNYQNKEKLEEDLKRKIIEEE